MQQVRRRWSWWWALAGLPIGAALVFLWWMHDDSDLRALDARAAAVGWPKTWQGSACATASPPEAIAAWRRIGQLAESLRAYGADERNFRAGFLPFDPTTRPDQAALRLHHAAMPSSQVEELITLVGRLPPEGVNMPWEPWTEVSYPGRFSTQEVNRMLLERAELGYETTAMVRAAIRITGACGPNSVAEIQLAGRGYQVLETGIRRLLLAGIALPDGTADLLDDARSRMARHLHRGLIAEWCWARALLDPSLEIGVDLRRQRAGIEEMVLAERLRGYGLSSPILRLARTRTLQGLFGISATLGVDPAAAWSIALREASREVDRLDFYGGSIGHVIMMHLRNDTRLRMLVADLRGRPWPGDPSDPVGLPVRRFTDKQRTGGYLFDMNGIDDRGSVSADHRIITGPAPAP